MELERRQRAEMSRTAFAAVASLAPLWAVLSVKQRGIAGLRLDNLHVGLIQALVLVFFRFIINLAPVRRAAPQVLAIAAADAEADAPPSRAAAPARKRAKKRKIKAAAKPGVDPRYNEVKLDDTLYRFLSIVDPSTLDLLTPLKPGSPKPPAPIPLTEWTKMHHDPEHRVTVYSHPSIERLYAISTLFLDVPLRNLWELLIDVSNRPTWDSLTEKTENLAEIGPRNSKEPVTQRQASVSWMGMKGMWPVKAKDLVLLSVIARTPGVGEKDFERLICATSSTEHDSKPVGGGYQRMELSISGFIAEQEDVDGQVGVRLTQLTDLSGIGWVPGKVLSVITTQMIPKSLGKIGKAAKSFEIPAQRKALEGDDWLPPEIGKFTEWPAADAKAAEAGADDEEVSEDESDDEDEAPRSASDVRTVADLVAQLRQVTQRLASVERGGAPAASGSWFSRFWPSSSTGAGGSGGDQAVAAGAGEAFGLGAIGGAAGAAAFFGLALLFGRRSARA